MSVPNIIYVNGRFLQQPMTGVQRYAREILNNMDGLLGEDRDYPGVQLTCLTPPGEIPNVDWKFIKIKQVGRNKRNLWEQLDLPSSVRRGFLFSPANVGPFVHPNQALTIHDASVFAVPSAYTFPFRLKYRLGMKILAHKARLIFTVSNFSRDELSTYLHIPRERFIPIHHGSEHLDSVIPDDSIIDEYRLGRRPFFLIVSSQSRHKNIVGLIQAIRKITAPVNFVMLGGRYKNVFRGFDLEGLPANIIQLDYTDDSRLAALYKHAAALIFPSFYEGFGLPLIEAMHFGCPVICSGIAPLTEVAGDAGLFFDPYNPEDIAEKILNFLENPALQDELKRKGLARSKTFSWKKAARETLDHLIAADPGSLEWH